jgi:phosphoenolpyruvate carboxylase
MNSPSSVSLEEFQNAVALRFQLYNSLFTSLPFHRIERTGILLSLFLTTCEEGYAREKSPREIVEEFFERHGTAAGGGSGKLDMLFRFVQYAERQVVLFDALEDAAFEKVNDLRGAGTTAHLEADVLQRERVAGVADKLRDFSVRLVLTAHPTQFYPGTVLGIINDLIDAIRLDDISRINTYLQQLGRTPFIKKQKPTPFDEAVSLIWYLENVFYDAVGRVAAELNQFFGKGLVPVRMGFWPGGDRDGNPFVTVETTLKTAAALRDAILRCYYRDVRRLKRRLTFAGVDVMLAALEQQLREDWDGERPESAEILDALNEIRRAIVERHDGLFVGLVDELIYKVESFGTFFATLDVRQEGSVHGHVLDKIAERGDSLPRNYAELPDEEKIEALLGVGEAVNPDDLDDELAADTLRTIAAIKDIQRQNGEAGCHRYIVSQCRSERNVFEVYGLFLLAGWKREEMAVDIVPLFETVDDLKHAAGVMRRLYENAVYKEHLRRRGNVQPIMLGFSDGTKDGGYLAANWSIYRAKAELSELSREFGVDVIFFDGRGGPPARGGGKTHRFYASMGSEVSDKAIELTIQGQTVSSNFGTVAAAQYNIEQLLHAGLHEVLVGDERTTFSSLEEELMERLAEASYRSYERLKERPEFLDYLVNVSPLRFYAETNIGSRPAKRGSSNRIEFKDLRAIPFVSAWAQLKQNVPGYYGVGSAIRRAEERGELERVVRLYEENQFFKALMDNCEMAMLKSYFPLTRFVAHDAGYGEMWRDIRDEFDLTREYLLRISGKSELMEDYPVERQSILMRERIMLPLTTIQQYALAQLREDSDLEEDMRDSLETLVVRCSFGIINAGRNSA